MAPVEKIHHKFALKDNKQRKEEMARKKKEAARKRKKRNKRRRQLEQDKEISKMVEEQYVLCCFIGYLHKFLFLKGRSAEKKRERTVGV